MCFAIEPCSLRTTCGGNKSHPRTPTSSYFCSSNSGWCWLVYIKALFQRIQIIGQWQTQTILTKPLLAVKGAGSGIAKCRMMDRWLMRPDSPYWLSSPVISYDWWTGTNPKRMGTRLSLIVVAIGSSCSPRLDLVYFIQCYSLQYPWRLREFFTDRLLGLLNEKNANTQACMFSWARPSDHQFKNVSWPSGLAQALMDPRFEMFWGACCYRNFAFQHVASSKKNSVILILNGYVVLLQQ